MANLNVRQVNFITRIKNFAKTLEKAYGEAHAIKNAYDEEFADTKDNNLSNADNLESTYNFAATDIEAAVTKAVSSYINFWTNVAIIKSNFGQELRRII